MKTHLRIPEILPRRGRTGPTGPTGETGGAISIPPEGCFEVTNIYVNAEGKLVIKYNIPE